MSEQYFSTAGHLDMQFSLVFHDFFSPNCRSQVSEVMYSGKGVVSQTCDSRLPFDLGKRFDSRSRCSFCCNPHGQGINCTSSSLFGWDLKKGGPVSVHTLRLKSHLALRKRIGPCSRKENVKFNEPAPLRRLTRGLGLTSHPKRRFRPLFDAMHMKLNNYILLLH